MTTTNATFKIDTKDSEYYDDSGYIYRFDGFICPLCNSKSYDYEQDGEGIVDYFISDLNCTTCRSRYTRSVSEYLNEYGELPWCDRPNIYETKYRLL